MLWYLVGGLLGFSVLLGFGLQMGKPDWSPLRLGIVSAAILAVPVLGLAIWLAVDVALSTAAQCGVDSCGMALMAAMFLATGAAMLFVVATALNYAIHTLLQRF